jgi:transcriptional regulator with XRE-family HTH domain
MEVERVREAIAVLKGRGWTLAAIADELSVHRDAVWAWETGRRAPANPRPVMMALERLLRRKRIPKRKRYTKKNPPTT